jgi:hypothetical protein
VRPGAFSTALRQRSRLGLASTRHVRQSVGARLSSPFFMFVLLPSCHIFEYVTETPWIISLKEPMDKQNQYSSSLLTTFHIFEYVTEMTSKTLEMKPWK